MAWRQSPGGSEQHLTLSAAAARTRTQRPGKHLAVHASELVVKPDFQILRRYRRPLLLRLEHTHRPTLEDYVHRATRLGSSRSLNLRIGGYLSNAMSASHEAYRHARLKGLLDDPNLLRRGPTPTALSRCDEAERDAAIAERDQALSQNDRLRHLLQQFQRMQFGKRSEKLDPDQLALAFEDIEQAIAATEADDDKKDSVGARARAEKRRASRGALPVDLPRVHVTIAPEDTDCPCCRAPMHVIREDTSQRLDVIPAQFRVIVTYGADRWLGLVAVACLRCSAPASDVV